MNYSMNNLGKIAETIQTSHCTLYILCGFPYSGKSYIAKELVNKTNITIEGKEILHLISKS